MESVIKVATAQIAPVYMNKEATIEKVIQTIFEAASNGADLIVFPETMIPGYPYWRSIQPNSAWAELMVKYQEESIVVGGNDTDQLSEAIRQAGICVALGVSELSDRPGSGTMYNSLLFFESDGRLVGRHRKLTPTHAERMVWGSGDASDLAVFDMSIGRVGGLICFEHHVTLFKAVMCHLGEEIHCAVWPGWFVQGEHPSIKRRWEAGDSLDSCDILPAVREYAYETQTFVASASQYVANEDLPEYAQGFNIAAGGSMMTNSSGQYLLEPVLGQEEVSYAEFDPMQRKAMKAYFDAQGHYARWDVVSLLFEPSRLEPIQPSGRDLDEAANKHGVELPLIESIAEDASAARRPQTFGAEQ